jgi:hypothetical protein
LLDFFDRENGQVGIYDAVNAISAERRVWKATLDQHGIQTIFVESLCDDQEIIEQNVRNVKISSPDVNLHSCKTPQIPSPISSFLPSSRFFFLFSFSIPFCFFFLCLLINPVHKYVGWNPDEAVKDYLARIDAKIPLYEPLFEPDFTYIKLINVNQRMEVCNTKGYLASRICFYLMNLHTQRRTLYFARDGRSVKAKFKADADLSEEGKVYARKLADSLIAFRMEEGAAERARGDKPRSLIVPLPPLRPPPPPLLPFVWIWNCFRLTLCQRSGHQPASAQNQPQTSSPPQSPPIPVPN